MRDTVSAEERDRGGGGGGGRGGGGGSFAVVLSQREPVKKELARGKTAEGGRESETTPPLMQQL